MAGIISNTVEYNRYCKEGGAEFERVSVTTDVG